MFHLARVEARDQPSSCLRQSVLVIFLQHQILVSTHSLLLGGLGLQTLFLNGEVFYIILFNIKYVGLDIIIIIISQYIQTTVSPSLLPVPDLLPL